MDGFVHDAPASRVLFGAGSRRRVPDEVSRLGRHRVLLIAGSRQRGHADELAAALGPKIAGRVHEVAPHVPAHEVDVTATMARELGADLLVCIGGGSATGLAKAVALRAGLPILAVATTYAGSEVSPIWGVTEHGRKITGRDRAALPVVAVYDPELTLSLPPDVSAASGMNALAHLVEGLYALDASPVTLLLAEEGVRALVDALPRVLAAPADPAARADALYGAWLAGSVLGTVTMGVHHKICHVLGGTYDLPHAGTHSAVLPFAAAFNARSAPDAMARLRRAMGTTAEPWRALHGLAAGIGAPTSLASVGFDAGRIDEAARLLAAQPPVNPRAVDEPAVRELLRAAHAGDLEYDPA